MPNQRRSQDEDKAIAQAFTVTVDINDFSKQTADLQRDWYDHLKTIIGDVLKSLNILIAKDPDGDAFWSPGGDGGTLSIVRGGATVALWYAIRTAKELRTRKFQDAEGN